MKKQNNFARGYSIRGVKIELNSENVAQVVNRLQNIIDEKIGSDAVIYSREFGGNVYIKEFTECCDNRRFYGKTIGIEGYVINHNGSCHQSFKRESLAELTVSDDGSSAIFQSFNKRGVVFKFGQIHEYIMQNRLRKRN